MSPLELNNVTLCAATSVNVDATMDALRNSLDQVRFADCILFTDQRVSPAHPAIRVVPIERMNSSRDYSYFLLTRLADFLNTDHCLIIQWDGFVVDASCWEESFLEFDYIGAPWPQFDDGHDVGNGGFSLRSRKLVKACRDPNFHLGHPEDMAICRTNRSFLERAHGIRFADHDTASRFAFERGEVRRRTFGFHGIFNLSPLFGADRFWRIYRSLNDPTAAFVDYGLLIRQLGNGANPVGRRIRLTIDRLTSLLRRQAGSGRLRQPRRAKRL